MTDHVTLKIIMQIIFVITGINYILTYVHIEIGYRANTL